MRVFYPTGNQNPLSLRERVGVRVLPHRQPGRGPSTAHPLSKDPYPAANQPTQRTPLSLRERVGVRVSPHRNQNSPSSLSPVEGEGVPYPAANQPKIPLSLRERVGVRVPPPINQAGATQPRTRQPTWGRVTNPPLPGDGGDPPSPHPRPPLSPGRGGTGVRHRPKVPLSLRERVRVRASPYPPTIPGTRHRAFHPPD